MRGRLVDSEHRRVREHSGQQRRVVCLDTRGDRVEETLTRGRYPEDPVAKFCHVEIHLQTRISDWLWYFCPCDQSSRLDFRGFLERNQATEGDTQWVNYKPAPFQFTFNGFLKVAFQGSRITSDAGLILVRELDERLGLAGLIAAHLRDSRHGRNTQFRLPDLLRQSVYSRLAGYEDLNDAQRLSTDPTFRLIGSPTRWDRSAALTSTLHWFETELLTP